MVFKKKGRMIDVRELQRRGVVRIPKEEISVPTNNDGFVELGNSSKIEKSANTSNTEFFGFMDSSDTSSPSSTTDNFSTENDGYSKREVDAKITELDNKIYKLENRIELLEKKLDVNQQSNPAVGVMGW